MAGSEHLHGGQLQDEMQIDGGRTLRWKLVWILWQCRVMKREKSQESLSPPAQIKTNRNGALRRQNKQKEKNKNILHQKQQSTWMKLTTFKQNMTHAYTYPSTVIDIVFHNSVYNNINRQQ